MPARAAAGAVAQLESENRHDEAKAFQAELDRANIRDCLVKVTWTGDADVDVLVLEPSGTECSFRRPRTSGGGVLVGDSATQESRNVAQGVSETYVCPEAFNGTYRVTIRRVWGKVTAGKVTVNVYAHYGCRTRSICATRFRSAIKTPWWSSTLMAAGAPSRLAISNWPMPRQGKSPSIARFSPSNSARWLRRTVHRFQSRRFCAQGLIGVPFIQQAVGYMPVITNIPSGATLFATGVVSADRGCTCASHPARRLRSWVR